MNEIEKSNSSTTELQIPTESIAPSSSTNKSPLLSSLLQASKSASSVDTFSNGQQDKSTRKNVFAMMGAKTVASSTTPTKNQETNVEIIVSQPSSHYDDQTFMTKTLAVAATQEEIITAGSNSDTYLNLNTSEVEANLLTTAQTDKVNNSINNNKFNNLNEHLHHSRNSNSNNNNSNNNRVSSSESTPVKSILENCLLKPSKGHFESHQHHHQKMDESDNHNYNNSPSTSAMLQQYTTTMDESRKVEPLKINLTRESVRTVIQQPYESAKVSPKLKIKALLAGTQTATTTTPPAPRNLLKSPAQSNTPATQVSPTLSSSSSLSSESSAEHINDNHNRSIQVIPKLHIKNLLENSLNHDASSEPQIVPKLTIRGFNPPPTSSTTTVDEQQNKERLMSSSLEYERHSNSPGIPKLTIKKDNNSVESYFNINNDNSIPKLHNKSNSSSTQPHLQKDGPIKLTIKPLTEPPVPKLTIKTNDNDKMFVTTNSSIIENQEQQSSIPKLTIHLNHTTETPTVPKVTIKPIVKPPDDVWDEETTAIPKLTIKAISSNNSTSPVFEKIVPKLVVKLPPKDQDYEHREKESSSNSSTPSPPHVHKLNIKPLPLRSSDKDLTVPKMHFYAESPSKGNIGHNSSEVLPKFSIKSIMSPTDTSPVSSNDHKVLYTSQPLEINTSVIKHGDSGLDSPRIVLKINKTNNDTITSETSFVENIPSKLVASNSNVNKRSHVKNNDTDDDIEASKKLKITESSDVIVIDSDTSNDASNHNNHVNEEDNETKVLTGLEESKKNLSGILTRVQRQRKNCSDNGKQIIGIVEDSNSKTEEGSSDPLEFVNNDSNASLSVLSTIEDLVTPKRGRGRPKKIVEKPPTPPPMESIDEDIDPLDSPLMKEGSPLKSDDNDGSVEVKKGRGRGRGRGRAGKRTVEVMKNGKAVQITLENNDEDDSPSFSLWNRSLGRGGSANRRARGGRQGRGKISRNSLFATPEKSRDGVFTSPGGSGSDYKESNNRRKTVGPPTFFEEDTRMSTGGGDTIQTPNKYNELPSNEESQSSMLSSTSNTVDGSSKKRSKIGKMEIETEGRAEFTIDQLAEYEWPVTINTTETFMIQEQLAEYLGIKSFKRKYPDLVRRPVEMEERNFLFENGWASEKMCDLGLTAVYASECLDIICNDYPEKYEEYKKYQREKHFRNHRLRVETVDKSQQHKDKAIQSASNWNVKFNKDRRENRRCCMDLQNFAIQVPLKKRGLNSSKSSASSYPVALVPGQYSEHFVEYTPEQLACFPINTVLVDHQKLEDYVASHPNPYDSDDDSSDSDRSEDESGSSSDSSSSRDSSSDEENSHCQVCTQLQYSNQYRQPEKLIKCTKCKNEAHPSCIEMSTKMFVRAQAYNWQCSSCKSCNKCRKTKDNKMLYCMQCDRGFHIYCLGLRNVPEGQYHCENCNICTECGTRSPEGHFNPNLTQQQKQDLAMVAHWTHEFTTNPLTNIREHKSTLCLPCQRRLNQKPTVLVE